MNDTCTHPTLHGIPGDNTWYCIRCNEPVAVGGSGHNNGDQP